MTKNALIVDVCHQNPHPTSDLWNKVNRDAPKIGLRFLSLWRFRGPELPSVSNSGNIGHERFQTSNLHSCNHPCILRLASIKKKHPTSYNSISKLFIDSISKPLIILSSKRFLGLTLEWELSRLFFGTDQFGEKFHQPWWWICSTFHDP